MKRIKKEKNILTIILCFTILIGIVMPVQASPESITLSSVTFDADYYYNTYTDLQATYGYDASALYQHYINYGLKEGRSGSAEFNCLIYRSNYSDLYNAFQDNYTLYCLHYEQCGRLEGRNATKLLEGRSIAEVSQGDMEAPIVVTVIELGSFSTHYNSRITRAINVELAAARIHGIILQPGQEFSFSQTILPRTAANGYVPATVINNGEYTTGYGGGICQVSSTLYAAMLYAGIPATEHHSHSLPVDYIPVGFDATIAAPSKDLRFVNIFDVPIQIIALTDHASGTLTVSIYAL